MKKLFGFLLSLLFFSNCFGNVRIIVTNDTRDSLKLTYKLANGEEKEQQMFFVDKLEYVFEEDSEYISDVALFKYIPAVHEDETVIWATACGQIQGFCIKIFELKNSNIRESLFIDRYNSIIDYSVDGVVFDPAVEAQDMQID